MQIQMSILLAFLCLLLATFTHAHFTHNIGIRYSYPRQATDLRVAELLAKLANQCKTAGCGLVDPAASGKKKRDDQPLNDSDEKKYFSILLDHLIKRAVPEDSSP
ncbi:hypothetical protein BsWGS_07189 [Bradybaena similaris]